MDNSTPCKGCGVELEQTGKGRPRKWCTRRCQSRTVGRATYAPRCQVSFPVCEFCGIQFSAQTRRKVRACKATECQRLIKNEQQRSYFAAYRQEHGKTYVHSRYADKRIEYKLKRRGLLAEECVEARLARLGGDGRWPYVERSRSLPH